MQGSSGNRTTGQRRVLLVGPDSSHQDYLYGLLETKGFRVIRAEKAAEARQKRLHLNPDLVIADLGRPELRDPVASFRVLVESAGASAAPLIVLHQQDELGPAVALLKSARADLLAKPVLADELIALIERAMVPGRRLAQADPRLLPEMIIGSSAAMLRVFEQVGLVAPKNTTVLITGETGTGKEQISRAIHALSGRRKMPMISVNCGGIPATLLEDEFFGHVKGAFTDAHQARVGRFEQAHRGTIFLDEIGDLPLELQPKLLRVVQEREIYRVGGSESIQLDVRVIAATNVDLWTRVDEGRFREDLFYRINVFPIHLPPLRERCQDIPLFVAHFLDRFCRRDKLAPKVLCSSAEAELMARPWPGNIRELENAVEIAVIRSQDRLKLEIADFPPPRNLFRSSGPAGTPDYKSTVARFEHDLILRVLDRTQGNKSQAAMLLGLKRTTLIEKLKKMTHSEVG